MTKRIALTFLLFVIIWKSNAQKTIVKGKVHKWISDTVYVCELPFHSPHSSTVKYHVISKDSTFKFTWNNKNEPFIISISPLKKFTDNNKESLLFENLTKKYYYGQCIKYYKCGSTTFLVEPNKTLHLDLTANTWMDTLSDQKAEYFRKLGASVKDDNTVRDYGETQIKFKGRSDNFNNQYFQDMLDRRTRLDQVLLSHSSKNLYLAIQNLTAVKNGLLQHLNEHKKQLNPVFYDYIHAEIEFTAKSELIKYLNYEQNKLLTEMIETGKIPDSILKIIAFDQFGLSSSAQISEMYNEYVEFYLNFIMNIIAKEFTEYHPFSEKKCEIAITELPRETIYYYISNHLLIAEDTSKYQKIYTWIMSNYPNGELNNKLKEKFTGN